GHPELAPLRDDQRYTEYAFHLPRVPSVFLLAAAYRGFHRPLSTAYELAGAGAGDRLHFPGIRNRGHRDCSRLPRRPAGEQSGSHNFGFPEAPAAAAVAGSALAPTTETRRRPDPFGGAVGHRGALSGNPADFAPGHPQDP